MAATALATPVDLAWVLHFTLAVASAVLSGAVPIVLVWLDRHLKISANSALGADLARFVETGAGLAYHELASLAAHNADPLIKDAAIAKGANFVAATAPRLVAALGLTPADVAAMLTGELGRLMAADPAISAGPSAVAPAKSAIRFAPAGG